MSLNRYAKRIDQNQAQIISALESAGASVLVISKPVDLLVSINGKFALFEVKNPNVPKADRQFTKAQKAFFDKHDGYPLFVVDGPEIAVRLLLEFAG